MAVVLIVAAFVAFGFLLYYVRFGRKVQCRSCGYYRPARAERCPRCGYQEKEDEIPPLIKRKDHLK